MRNRPLFLMLTVILSVAAAAAAQQKDASADTQKKDGAATAPQKPESGAAATERFSAPGPEHKILQKKVGVWDVDYKYWNNPEAPPAVFKGASMFRMLLGGRFLEQDHEGEMQGVPYFGRGLTGFDRRSKKYVSVWMDTMSTGFNVTEGTCDAAGKVCTETGEVDDVVDGRKTKVKMVTTFQDADMFVVEMFVSQPDGPDVRTMLDTYTRQK